jgi:glycosyltransferase involved in cell wall biosynthesis
MRILMAVERFFPDSPAGMPRVAWDVARGMASRGHSVTLVCAFAGEGGFPRQESVDGVKVVRFARPKHHPWNPGAARANIAAFADALSVTLANGSFDVGHAHNIYSGTALMRVAQGRFPFVYTIHSPAVEEQRINWSQHGWLGRAKSVFGLSVVKRLERAVLEAAAARHTLSEYTAFAIQQSHRTLNVAFTQIPHWVDASWVRTIDKTMARSRLGWPLDVPILLSVRELRYRYGLDTAIEAVASLAPAQPVKYFIVGSGESRTSLEQLIRQRDAADRITLLGRLSETDLRLAYQAADLFVLPTRALECFGLIVLEALAADLPVLATRVGAIPEILAPVLPTHLVPAGDPAALRVAIEKILPATVEAAPSQHLSSYVTATFHADDVLTQYEHLYQSAIAR